MIYKSYSELEGKHSFFSPSQSSWLNWFLDYKDGKLTKDQLYEIVYNAYSSKVAADNGTKIHEIACKWIKRGRHLPKSKVALRAILWDEIGKDSDFVDDLVLQTLYMYVNDAIDNSMTPELTLKMSDDAFGTTDCVCMQKGKRKDILKIHDLKTGKTPAKMRQLFVYAAYYCYDYNIDPKSIDIECKIYQLGEIQVDHPDPEFIQLIIDSVNFGTDIVSKMKGER